MVHILVSSYTASKPWVTDWVSRAANSCRTMVEVLAMQCQVPGCRSRITWLLKILRLQPGGILHTVVASERWWRFSWW